jgi:6-phosphogluconolactonase
MTQLLGPSTSRRDFLANIVLGAIGMAITPRLASSDSELLYVGTYTDEKHDHGVYLVRLDSRTGALELLTSFDAGPNPSFLAIHPNGRVLYAVNEVAEHDGSPSGAVSAFAIAGNNGALARIGMQSSGGRGPCYVSVDRVGRAVLVANYDSGTVALLPVDGAGSVGPASIVIQHAGHGPNAERQEGPHAHSIVANLNDRFALAADLGADRVFVYELDTRAGALRHREQGDAVMHPGSGPRHLAFHPRLPMVFVANELDSTVTSLRFDDDRGVLSPISSASTLPASWRGENYPADIHVSSSGNIVYVSNRGHDSIAVLRIGASGTLTLIDTVSTGGNWPRNFSLDPTGRWLLAANQRSNTIVVLHRDPATGRLTMTDRHLDIPSPACVRFRAQVGVVT